MPQDLKVDRIGLRGKVPIIVALPKIPPPSGWGLLSHYKMLNSNELHGNFTMRPICLTDSQGFVVDVPGRQDGSGFSLDSGGKNRHFADWAHPQDQDSVRAIFDRIEELSAIMRFCHRFISPAGDFETRTWAIQSFTRTGTIVINEIISIDSEAHDYSHLERLDEGTVLLNPDGIIHFINRAATQMLGFDGPAPLGKSFVSLFPDFSDFLNNLGLEPEKEHRQTVTIRQSYKNLQVRGFAGKKEIQLSIKPFHFSSNLESLVTENIERLELIAQTTTDVIWDWNLINRQFWISDTAYEFIEECQFSENAPAEAWYASVVESDRERVMRELQLLIKSQKQSGVLVYQAKKRCGATISVKESIRVLRDTGHRPVRVIGCVRDISEQQHLETQLMRAQRLESIGRMAGGIAHDLNNVLTPVSMAIDLMELGNPSFPDQKIVGTLRKSVSHGANLLKQLLVFARGSEAEKLLVDTQTLADDVIGIAKDTFPRSIRISYKIEPNVPQVHANATQLRQVILNLLVNARDAIEGEGEIKVRVWSEEVDRIIDTHQDLQLGNYVVFAISDSGTGIAPEDLEHIWDPFFSTKEVGKGTGLGLSTAAAIVNSHRGAIRVKSKPGEGCTFQVYIPVGAKTQTPAAVVPFQTSDHSGGNGRTIRILFADRDQSIRIIGKKILEKHGFAVQSASKCSEVRQALTQSAPFDLLICELDILTRNDAQIVQIVRERHPALTILGTSANENPDVSTQNNFNAFLAKPFSAEELFLKIEELLKPRTQSLGIPL